MASRLDIPQNLWSLTDEDLRVAVFAGSLGDLNVSSLLKSYLDLLHECHVQDDFYQPKPRSLRSTALEGVVKWLNTSPDILNSAQEITSNLNEVILHDVLSAPSLRYSVLRACIGAVKVGDGQSIVDIDEIVLTNERYLSSEVEQITDDSYLISLEEFCTILSITSNDQGFGLLHRPSLPGGGVEFRNPKHQDPLLIRTSSADVAAELRQDLGNELRDLDWGNVLVAGDPVMRAVMNKQVVPDRSRRRWMCYKPIELYLYGLSVGEANQKAGQIHDVWASNISAAADERTVVKDGADITLISSKSIRPVRIRSKLFRSPTEALLDLGPGAIGFDGSQIVMLPRCARALETGYLTLTMDYVWDPVFKQVEEKMGRLVQHDNLGFGQRILPSYVKSVTGTAPSLPSIPDPLKEPRLGYLRGREHLIADIPDFYWDGDSFNLSMLAQTIDQQNEAQFFHLQGAICDRLQIPPQRFGYSNYLTRRIRRYVYGPDFNAIQEKQITIPMVVPAELEAHIYDSILPQMNLDYQPLIPVHDPSKHDPQNARLPSLPVSGHDSGNLRYWIVSNESMWAGQHALDDLSRALWYLDTWFRRAPHSIVGTEISASTATPECLYRMVQLLRMQIEPAPPDKDVGEHIRRKQGLPPLREALLFRAFVFGEYPFQRDVEDSDEDGSDSSNDEDVV